MLQAIKNPGMPGFFLCAEETGLRLFSFSSGFHDHSESVCFQ